MTRGEKITTLLSTGFYTGYFPFAPATFSTMALGIPCYLLMCRLNPYLYSLITLILYFLAVRVSDESEKIFKKKDASFIVIDELVGFLITMFLLPVTWVYVVLGFFIFRFFDIVKPPPANIFNNRKKGGLDVVLDDVFAGIYSCIVLHLIRIFVLS